LEEKTKSMKDKKIVTEKKTKPLKTKQSEKEFF